MIHCVRIVTLLSLIFMLAACNRTLFNVHTEYVGCENLASYHVGTPDPRLACPPFGQRLIISWWGIPKMCFKDPTLQLNLKVRLRDRSEANISIPVKRWHGVYVYSLLNQKYLDAGGIQTYKVCLTGINGVYEEWKHHLWKDLILFPEKS